MREAIAFLAGMIAMMIVWFANDTLLKHIVCPNCGDGYVIETGEEMKEVTG